MKLYEHPDFEQAILRARNILGNADCAPQSLRRITTSPSLDSHPVLRRGRSYPLWLLLTAVPATS